MDTLVVRPTRALQALQQWLQAEFGCKFTEYGNNLHHGHQEDATSCGIVTANTITHAVFWDDLWSPRKRQFHRLRWFAILVHPHLEWLASTQSRGPPASPVSPSYSKARGSVEGDSSVDHSAETMTVQHMHVKSGCLNCVAPASPQWGYLKAHGSAEGDSSVDSSAETTTVQHMHVKSGCPNCVAPASPQWGYSKACGSAERDRSAGDSAETAMETAMASGSAETMAPFNSVEINEIWPLRQPLAMKKKLGMGKKLVF